LYLASPVELSRLALISVKEVNPENFKKNDENKGIFRVNRSYIKTLNVDLAK